MPVILAIILAPIATVLAVVAAMSPIVYAIAVAVVGVALFATSSSSPTAYLTTDTGPIVDAVATPIGVASVRADRVVRVAGLAPVGVRILSPMWDDAASDDDVRRMASAMGLQLQREVLRLEGAIVNARRSRHRTRADRYAARLADVRRDLASLQ